MQSPTNAYRSDLRNFLDDLLSFILEQLNLAVAKAEDQVAVVDAATCAIPLMREKGLSRRSPGHLRYLCSRENGHLQRVVGVTNGIHRKNGTI